MEVLQKTQETNCVILLPTSQKTCKEMLFKEMHVFTLVLTAFSNSQDVGPAKELKGGEVWD